MKNTVPAEVLYCAESVRKCSLHGHLFGCDISFEIQGMVQSFMQFNLVSIFSEVLYTNNARLSDDFFSTKELKQT